jgi:hypothetical protein
MNDDWNLMKMRVQGKIAPPKSYSKDWDDNWEQDERYYMYSQNTGDFNVLAQISLEMLIETTESFKELAKKYTISNKEVKEHKRLVKISTDLHQKTRLDNLWDRDCPNDYKKCANAALDVWKHEYDLRRQLNGF